MKQSMSKRFFSKDSKAIKEINFMEKSKTR